MCDDLIFQSRTMTPTAWQAMKVKSTHEEQMGVTKSMQGTDHKNFEVRTHEVVKGRA